jgi:hypothetical protein
MQTLVERGCGLDVHQATVVACLLIFSPNGNVRNQMRTFGTTSHDGTGTIKRQPLRPSSPTFELTRNSFSPAK